MKQQILGVLERFGVKSNIARNSVYLLAAEMLARVINLSVIVVLARQLGPERVGVIKLVTSYGILFAVYTDLGLSRIAVREIVRAGGGEVNRMIGHLTIIRVGLCFLAMGLMWGSLLTRFGADIQGPVRFYLLLWSVSIIAQSFRRNAETVFLATEKMQYQAALLVANRLMSATFICLSIAFGWGIAGVFTAYLTADVIDALASALFVRTRLYKPTYSANLKPMLALLWVGLPFSLQMLAGQVYYYIDTVMLNSLYISPGAVGKMAIESAVRKEIGYYSSAYQLVLTLIFIPLSISNSVFPALSKGYTDGDIPRMRSLFGYSYNLCMLLGFPIAALFFTFRAELLPLIYGTAYVPSIPMLAIVVWTLPFICLTMPIGGLLAATDRQMLVTISAFLNVIFNVSLNWKIIPTMGGRGASWATLLTEAFCLATLLLFSLKAFRTLFDFRTLGKLLLFHALAIALLVYVTNIGGSLYARLPLMAAYAILTVLWGRSMMQRRRVTG